MPWESVPAGGDMMRWMRWMRWMESIPAAGAEARYLAKELGDRACRRRNGHKKATAGVAQSLKFIFTAGVIFITLYFLLKNSLMGWLMGLEPTTTGITILSWHHSFALIGMVEKRKI